MKLSSSLTVAVITCRRPKLLKRCLFSFLKQKTALRIIIIDNDYQQTSKKICQSFSKKLSLKYLVCPIKSIPRARSLAIESCETNYLAFIDDDCCIDRHWSEIARELISANPNTAYWQGQTYPPAKPSLLDSAHFQIYSQWLLHPHQGLDTKNIIINLSVVKKYHLSFDPNFPIFEDIDFGLQLNQHHLSGMFIPKLIVSHHEYIKLFPLIRKYFYRGQIKFAINQKWGNFDNYQPTLDFFTIIKKLATNFFKALLEISFDSGFKYAQKYQILPNDNHLSIINRHDRGANQERLEAITNFLHKNNFQVTNIDSEKILLDCQLHRRQFLKENPLAYLLIHLSLLNNPPFRYFFSLLLRGYLLNFYLHRLHTKKVISQYSEDIFVAIYPHRFQLILDLPTIFSEELKLSHRLPLPIINIITRLENLAYSKADHTCFHWSGFLNYARKIGKKIPNSFILNWGCNSVSKVAVFKKHPKIIYLGDFTSPWTNPSLLLRLQKTSSIDIFSYQTSSKFKTKGYLKNLQKLSLYQFGLITITNDPLRNNGFSAKYLKYLEHGLPVLCPEWRRDPLLKPATIYYNERNFVKQLKKYSQKKLWLKKHQAALRISKNLNWNKTLLPLLPKINSSKNEY